MRAKGGVPDKRFLGDATAAIAYLRALPYVLLHHREDRRRRQWEGCRLDHATVYLDHPYFTQLEHTLNIDFADDAGARVAVELSPESARALVRSIEEALARS